MIAVMIIMICQDIKNTKNIISRVWSNVRN